MEGQAGPRGRGDDGVEVVSDIGKGAAGGQAVRRIKGAALGSSSHGWVSKEGASSREEQLIIWGKADMVVRDPFELKKVSTDGTLPQSFL